MGLDAFLSEEESLIAGRSFGSVPWMYSGFLPVGTPPTAFLKREGVIHVTIDAFDCIEMFRERKNDPPKVKLAVTYKDVTLYSKYHSLEGENLTVTFDETFTFAAPPELPFDSKSNETIRISLYEPGLHLDQKVGCCSLISSFFRGVVDVIFPNQSWRRIPLLKKHGVVEKATLNVANVATAALGSATLVGDSDVKNLNDGDLSPSSNPAEFTIELRFGNIQQIKQELVGKKLRKDVIMGGTSSLPLTVQCKWRSPQHDVRTDRFSNVRIAVPSKKTTPIAIHSSKDKSVRYEAVNGVQLLKSEYVPEYREILEEVYDPDPLGPRTTSSSGAPPVKRVKAVYGINLPTEVGAVYCRRNIVQQDGRMKCLHEVDATARVETRDYAAKDGLVLEHMLTPQACLNDGDKEGTNTVCRSGDGTVPYFSLQQSQMWKNDECDVSVVELPEAEHRAILADERFLKILLDYVIVPFDPNSDSKVSS